MAGLVDDNMSSLTNCLPFSCTLELIIALIRINRICLVIVLLEENRVDEDGSSKGTLAQQHGLAHFVA